MEQSGGPALASPRLHVIRGSEGQSRPEREGRSDGGGWMEGQQFDIQTD